MNSPILINKRAAQDYKAKIEWLEGSGDILFLIDV